MKQVLMVMILSAAIPVIAQNTPTNGGDMTRKSHGLPAVTLTAEKLTPEEEWAANPASHIPVKAHVPFYDTTLELNDGFTREVAEDHAENYFKKVFESKSYRLETEKHNYTGYGYYLFCADKKAGLSSVYKVYYRVTIKVKNSKCLVDLHDFTIENQHNEVSFDNLIAQAKNNSTVAKNILTLFHQNNEIQLGKILASMDADTEATTVLNN